MRLSCWSRPDHIKHLQDIPRLEIPLHTLIELTPKPDGTMAEERIPLDVKGTNPEDLAIHLQKRMNLQSGPYATPMTPFSPFEGGGSGDSPFARVDSMGMGGDQLPSVSSDTPVWYLVESYVPVLLSVMSMPGKLLYSAMHIDCSAHNDGITGEGLQDLCTLTAAKFALVAIRILPCHRQPLCCCVILV